MLTKLLVRGNEEWHDIDHERPGAPASVFNSARTNVGDPFGKKLVRVIPISEYARMDVACSPVLEALVSTSLQEFSTDEVQSASEPIRAATVVGCNSWDCVDDWPLIAGQTTFYGTEATTVGVDVPEDYGNVKSNMVEIGDWLHVRASAAYPLSEEMASEFSKEGLTAENRKGSAYGLVRAIWRSTKTFESSTCHGDESSFSDRERDIIGAFTCRITPQKQLLNPTTTRMHSPTLIPHTRKSEQSSMCQNRRLKCHANWE